MRGMYCACMIPKRSYENNPVSELIRASTPPAERKREKKKEKKKREGERREGMFSYVKQTRGGVVFEEMFARYDSSRRNL